MLIKLLETPEKPEHPMDFIRENLGATQAEERRIETLEQEVIDYKKEVTELKTQLETVKTKLKEYEQKTEVKASGDVKNDEKPSVASVQETDAKDSDSKQQINGGGAEVDTNKDKTITESETAATPSSNAATVDSAKTANECENAEVGKSTSAKTADEKPIASAIGTASDEADSTKSTENAASATNSTEKEK